MAEGSPYPARQLPDVGGPPVLISTMPEDRGVRSPPAPDLTHGMPELGAWEPMGPLHPFCLQVSPNVLQGVRPAQGHWCRVL